MYGDRFNENYYCGHFAINIESLCCLSETNIQSIVNGHSVVSNSLRPHVLYSPWNSGILEWVAFPSPGDLPKSGINPRSPALHVDSLPAESQWKPKDTGVSSLSLLQWIFLIQESNQGLLHCRQILYQLSYKGSPIITKYLLLNSPLTCDR